MIPVQIPYQENYHYSKEIEQKLIGAVLMAPKEVDKVITLLKPKSFFFGHLQSIYGAITEMYHAGFPIDLLTVVNRLYDLKVNEMEGESTAYYLTKLTSEITSTVNIITWANIILEKHARRELLKISFQALDTEKDVFETAASIEAQLKQVFESRNDEWQDLSVVSLKLLRHIERIEAGENQFITTSFRFLDELNGGFRAGDLVVVGARPGVGKSSLMGRMALHVAKLNKVVGIISLEMLNHRVLARIASLDTDIEHWKIDRAKFDDENKRAYVIEQLAKMANRYPVYMSDTPRININDIRVKAKRLKENKGLDILFIDYLQLVETDGTKNSNREQEVAKISRGLKVLALELQIPIVLLAQLNRQAEARANKRPQLSDLRESGSIEQDADVVILLHRDWQSGVLSDEEGNSTERSATIIVPKWRDGSTVNGEEIGWDGQKMKFYEPSEHNVFEPTQFPKANTDTLRNAFKPIRDFSQPQGKEEDPF